jgi:hypothetical protein
MSMVDWLLTEQLVEIFREAKAKSPELNAELIGRSPHAEEDILAGAGTAARVDATNGATFLITPKRIARLVGEQASDLVLFPELIGYDWISPEMSEKVALKDEFYDRLYLYPRGKPPIRMDALGPAVYPVMSFLARVLEYQSQKVILRKLDDDVVETLGRVLTAVVKGPFFTDADLMKLFRRDRRSLEVLSVMWPRMNLAAPELSDLLQRAVRELVERRPGDEAAWIDWVGEEPARLETAVDLFGRVAGGEV